MNKKGTFLMRFGLLLLAAALLLTGYNIWESKQAETASASAVEGIMAEMEKAVEQKEETTGQEKAVPDYVLFPEKEMPVIKVDGQYYIGVLQIPELGLNLPIMSGEWSYAKLRKAPCQYTGSVYQDNLVIAGHNYRSHFSRIKGLSVGSEIRFADAEGNVFDYTIGWVDILQPEDVEEMRTAEGWDLTLFTCTYGGGERYTVRCVRKK